MMFTLPKPSHGFDWVQLPAGPALACPALGHRAPHLFTTRSWRLGEHTAASADGAGWDEVATAMEVGSAGLARLRQVHGTTVVCYGAGKTAAREHLPDGDIVISDDPDVAIAVQTADCVPILIVDFSSRVIAAVHAGWRGLAARAPQVALERLAAEFGSRPDSLRAAIGPAIGACCYEVGPEVLAQFERSAFTETYLRRWFSAGPVVSLNNPPMASLSPVRREGHSFFDPALAAYDQLRSAGLASGHVFSSGLCTASHPNVFCSYRRDGAPAGRMAAAIRWGTSGLASVSRRD
jgi:polyphenol oxidase